MRIKKIKKFSKKIYIKLAIFSIFALIGLSLILLILCLINNKIGYDITLALGSSILSASLLSIILEILEIRKYKRNIEDLLSSIYGEIYMCNHDIDQNLCAIQSLEMFEANNYFKITISPIVFNIKLQLSKIKDLEDNNNNLLNRALNNTIEILINKIENLITPLAEFCNLPNNSERNYDIIRNSSNDLQNFLNKKNLYFYHSKIKEE